MPRSRIFFPRRRLKRRFTIGAGIAAATIIVFAAGFYTGSTHPDLFSAPRKIAAKF
jgi:hypothetical protein